MGCAFSDGMCGDDERIHGLKTFFKPKTGSPSSSSPISAPGAWVSPHSILTSLISSYSLMLPVALVAANGETVSRTQRESRQSAFPPRVLTPAINTFHLAQHDGSLPLSCEPNHGQVQEPVEFLSRHQDFTIFLIPTEEVLALRRVNSEKLEGKSEKGSHEPLGVKCEGMNLSLPFVWGGAGGVDSLEEKVATTSSVVRMKFAGGNQVSTVKGIDQLPGMVNYFIGNDLDQ